MQRIMMPMGIDSFRELVKNTDPHGNHYTFVDKSLFIKDYLGDNAKVLLITRPRRFGKTLAMSMLHHFLAPETIGEPTQGLFDGLKISKHPEIMSHQGQYPTIFITLKDTRGRTFQESFDTFKYLIKDAFSEHRAILHSDKISEEDKKIFRDILEVKATDVTYKKSLLFLTQLLHQHTGRKAVLLMDEYDTPIHEAYIQDYYPAWIGFVKQLLGSALKGNDYLAKAVFTSILRVGKESLFSGLNNVKVCSVLENEYTTHFGFTEDEVDELFKTSCLPKKAHELKEWYNGYQIGEQTMYNPFSIVSFVDKAFVLGMDRLKDAVRPYWINTSGHELLMNILQQNLLQIQPKLLQLYNKVPIETTLDDRFVFQDLYQSEHAFWNLLFSAGYLKSIKAIEDPLRPAYQVLFPNEEIRMELQRVGMRVASARQGYNTYLDWMYSLVKGNIEHFSTGLNYYLESSVSYFDGAGREGEKFYHGLMLGLSGYLADYYCVTSNRESGLGRYDIALEPHDKSQRGVVLELKYVQEEDDLEAAAKEALSQIETKQYETAMQQHGIQQVIKLGLAFHQKQAKLAY